ncbi:MAG: PAS domain S-box protein [Nitrospiraceae bacterium]|nr:MAG: PAS domain S-box protein [Nitrospiraceae bacterium]
MKLFHKIILGFFAVLIMGFATGFLAVDYSKKLMQKTFIASTESMALKVLDEIEREIDYKIELLQGYSRSLTLQKTVESSNREFSKLDNVNEYLTSVDDNWESASSGNISDVILGLESNSLALELKEKQNFYKDSQGYNVFGEIFVTNVYGANVAQTGKTSDYKQSDEEWWQIARDKGVYVGDIEFDESSQMYSFSIAERIMNEYGNFSGVIKAVINFQEVLNAIKMDSTGLHKKHKTMNFTLVNNKGNVIYSTEQFKFLENVAYLLGEEAELHLNDQHDKVNSTYKYTQVPGNHENDLFIIHVHSRQLIDTKGLNWTLLVSQEVNELFAPVKELQQRMLMTTFVVALIAILIGLLLSKYITRNFEKLQYASIKIGSGELGTQINVESDDEIGQLAHAFNKMSRDLESTSVARNELAQEIKRRKLAEESIIDSEERFRSVAENASDAIIYIDSRGEIIFWNKAAEHIFGYTGEEIVGQVVTKIMPERYHDQHQKGIKRFIETGVLKYHDKAFEMIALRKGGTEFPVELSISSWKIREDIFFTAIIRDISKRKHTEEIIQQQVGRLNALRSIDRAIIASLDLHVTLDVFLTQVVAQQSIDAASVLLLNQHTQMLEYVASQGFRSEALKYTKLRLGESNAGRAAIEREIVSIPDLRDDMLAFSRSDNFVDEGFVSYYAVPLIAKGQVKGVMELFNRTYKEHEAGWLDFLEAIADQGAIALDNASMFEELQRANTVLTLAYDSTLEGWARALDLRDKETEGHSRRVTEITVRIAREFQLKDDEMIHIRRGALLHDIGKMGIPDSILLKPGKLTEEEWVIMKLHPVYARDLMYPIEHLRPAIDIPYYHHEKWDGSGYPDGLKGEHIPLAARIFAVVDVWDALRSDRPYRPAWPREKVEDYIRSLVGTQFDAGVVEMFLALDLESEKAPVNVVKI